MKNRKNRMTKLHRMGGAKSILIIMHKDIALHFASSPDLSASSDFVKNLSSSVQKFAEQKFRNTTFTPGPVIRIEAEEAIALMLEFAFKNNQSLSLNYSLIRNTALNILQNFDEEKLSTYAHNLSENNSRCHVYNYY